MIDRPFLDVGPEPVPYEGDRSPRPAQRAESVERQAAMLIAEQVATRFEMTAEEMLGPDQDRRHARARAGFYGELRRAGWSLRQVARVAGRDPKAVSWALRHYESA